LADYYKAPVVRCPICGRGFRSNTPEQSLAVHKALKHGTPITMPITDYCLSEKLREAGWREKP